ncbi:hypothetical protein D3C87_352860 [compost metagenome]
MDFNKKDLQNKQGLVQQKAQMDNKYSSAGEETKNKDEFGLIPAFKENTRNAGKDLEGDASLQSKEISLEEIDNHNISEIRPKRMPWNSITFDRDDFFSGLAHA